MILKTLFSTMLVASSLSNVCFSKPQELLPLSDKQGIERFLESEFRKSYWLLSQYYEAQITGSFCGIASATMVLNALQIPRPSIPSPGKYPLALFTQDNFFSEKVSLLIDKQEVLKQGVTLDKLAKAISTWGVETKVVSASTLTIESFRDLLKLYLVKTDQFIIANYKSPYGGHMSPIAAYDQKIDSVLILNVNKYNSVASWMDLALLLKSMQTIDSHTEKSRGLIFIQKM